MRNIPFLRLLLPLLAGILLSQLMPLLVPLPLLLLLLGASLGFHLLKPQSPRLKIAFAVTADLLLVFVALDTVYHSNPWHSKDYYGHFVKEGQPSALAAEIVEVPVERGKWLRCETNVRAVLYGDAERRTKGKLLLYLEKSELASSLKPGSVLTLHAAPSTPGKPLNPDEFNYRDWLQKRHICFTAFVKKGNYQLTGANASSSAIWLFGLNCRSWTLAKLRQSALTPANYAICAALLTGMDDDIDRQTMSAFAHSGTLHILSVSGLHIGLIYLVLGFAMNRLLPGRRLRLPRFIFVLIFLWGFALITGFAAPVLRAVIMFSLVGLGNLYFRNDGRNSLNLLCVSAFILLLFNPLFLFDLGFLLSYFAMFGLIAVTPFIQKVYAPRFWLDDVIWKSISASVAATVTTLPVTLFFFRQFPTWFFLSNLLVVPLSFVMLLLAVLILPGIPGAAWLCNQVGWLMKASIDLVNVRGWGYVDEIDFDVFDALFLTALLILIAIALNRRSFVSVTACIITLIAWQLTALVSSVQSKLEQKLTVYHVRKHAAASLHVLDSLWYYCDDSAAVSYHMQPHFSAMNNADKKQVRFACVSSAHENVVFAESGRDEIPAGTSILILQGHSLPEESKLAKLSRLKMVACDGTCSGSVIAAASAISRKFGLLFHNTAVDGALEIPLQ